MSLHRIDLKGGWSGGRYYEYLSPKKFSEILAPMCFQKKIDFSALLEPIFMKFGGVVDIAKTITRIFFRYLGAQFEVLERI